MSLLDWPIENKAKAANAQCGVVRLRVFRIVAMKQIGAVSAVRHDRGANGRAGVPRTRANIQVKFTTPRYLLSIRLGLF